MEIPVISQVFDAITDDLLAYTVFGTVAFMLVTGTAASIPVWFVPIIALIGDKYFKKATPTTVETTK